VSEAKVYACAGVILAVLLIMAMWSMHKSGR